MSDIAGQVKELQAECELHKGQSISFERTNAMLLRENEIYKSQIADITHKQEFYMRYVTELVTNLSNIDSIAATAEAKAGSAIANFLSIPEIRKILSTAIQRAKDAAYKPTNAAPARQRPPEPGGDDGEPSPKFLHEVPRAVAKRNCSPIRPPDAN